MTGNGAADLTQLLKGVLDLAVLAVLAERDSYGYDVVRRLRETGLDGLGDASVYGTLRRLHQAGALASYSVPSAEGPHRKYYCLTDDGRALMARSASAWFAVTRALGGLLDGRKEIHT
jgi:PadR family transcriptional regulator, regulatory protein PadR